MHHDGRRHRRSRPRGCGVALQFGEQLNLKTPSKQTSEPASLAMPARTFSSISAFGISLRLFRPAIYLSDELACTASCGSGRPATDASLPLGRVAAGGVTSSHHWRLVPSVHPRVVSKPPSTQLCGCGGDGLPWYGLQHPASTAHAWLADPAEVSMPCLSTSELVREP